MTPPPLTRELVESTNAKHRKGTPLPRLCAEIGITVRGMYKAMRRFGIEPAMEGRLSITQHFDHYCASDVPLEVYAFRADVKASSLISYPRGDAPRLPRNSREEKYAWWAAMLDGYCHEKAGIFRVMNNLSTPLIAYWYHQIHNPAESLLWGFQQTLELHTDQFDDLYRFADTQSQLFAIGKGRVCSPVGIRIANAAYPLTRQGTPHEQAH